MGRSESYPQLRRALFFRSRKVFACENVHVRVRKCACAIGSVPMSDGLNEHFDPTVNIAQKLTSFRVYSTHSGLSFVYGHVCQSVLSSVMS